MRTMITAKSKARETGASYCCRETTPLPQEVKTMEAPRGPLRYRPASARGHMEEIRHVEEQALCLLTIVGGADKIYLH